MGMSSGSQTRKATKTTAAQNSGGTPRGRPFAKGQSGNPGGRPKIPDSVRDACRAHTDQAIATLAEVMSDPGCPASARITAATSLLDRGWGKPESQADVRLVTNATPAHRSLVDVSKLTPEQTYLYILNGDPLPTEVTMSKHWSNGRHDHLAALEEQKE